MTIFAILLILVGSSLAGVPCNKVVAKRTSPCTASPAEQAKIMKLIDGGMDAYAEFENKNVSEASFRDSLLAAERGGQEIPETLWKQWKDANKAMFQAKAKMQSNLNEAANLTSLYYGLGHKPRDIANGPLERREARWKPQFAYAAKGQDGNYESVYRKHALQPENEAHYLELNFGKVGGGFQAFTLEDGSVNISIEAFELARRTKSPRLLAKTIFHEGIHFDDLVGDGWEASREAMEPAAYARTQQAADIFELTPLESIEIISQRMSAELNLKEVEAGRFMATPSFSTPAERMVACENLEARQAEDSEVEGKRRALEEGFEAAREEMDRARKERIRREELERLENENRRKEEAAEHDRRLRLVVRDIAVKLCADSGSVGQEELDRLPRPLDPGFYLGDIPDGLEGNCAGSLYVFLGMSHGSGRKPDIAEFRKMAAPGVGVAPPFEETRPAPTSPGAIEATPPPNAAGELASLAEKACSNPGSVTQDDVKKLWWFPDAGIAFTEGVGGGLNGCARDLFFDFVGFCKTWERGTRINPDWVNDFARRWAEERRPSPPPGDSPGGQDRPERERGGKKDPCYDEPGVGRVCPTR